MTALFEISPHRLAGIIAALQVMTAGERRATAGQRPERRQLQSAAIHFFSSRSRAITLPFSWNYSSIAFPVRRAVTSVVSCLEAYDGARDAAPLRETRRSGFGSTRFSSPSPISHPSPLALEISPARIASKRSSWRSQKHAEQWESRAELRRPTGLHAMAQNNLGVAYADRPATRT